MFFYHKCFPKVLDLLSLLKYLMFLVYLLIQFDLSKDLFCKQYFCRKTSPVLHKNFEKTYIRFTYFIKCVNKNFNDLFLRLLVKSHYSQTAQQTYHRHPYL